MRHSIALAAALCALVSSAAFAASTPSAAVNKQEPQPYALVVSFTCKPHEAAASSTSTPERALADGDAAMARDDCAEAVADYGVFVAAKPDDVAGYWRRAVGLMALGVGEASADYFDKAIPDLDKAIAIDPKSAALFELRGLARQQTIASNARKRSPITVSSFVKKNLSSVNDDYTQAISLDPNFGEAYGARYLTDVQRNDAAQAGYDQRKAQILDPAMLDVAQGRVDTIRRNAAEIDERYHRATMAALQAAVAFSAAASGTPVIIEQH